MNIHLSDQRVHRSHQLVCLVGPEPSPKKFGRPPKATPFRCRKKSRFPLIIFQIQLVWNPKFLSGVSFLNGCVWKWLVPLNPMVLLIIIPFLNGYFIGNIPYFQTNPNVISCPASKTSVGFQYLFHPFPVAGRWSESYPREVRRPLCHLGHLQIH